MLRQLERGDSVRLKPQFCSRNTPRDGDVLRVTISKHLTRPSQHSAKAGGSEVTRIYKPIAHPNILAVFENQFIAMRAETLLVWKMKGMGIKAYGGGYVLSGEFPPYPGYDSLTARQKGNVDSNQRWFNLSVSVADIDALPLNSYRRKFEKI